MEQTFKPGDPIIWDSNFGYDVGHFVCDSNLYYHYRVTLATGVLAGNDATVIIHSVKPYSEELLNELTKKYGYRKELKRGTRGN